MTPMYNFILFLGVECVIRKEGDIVSVHFNCLICLTVEKPLLKHIFFKDSCSAECLQRSVNFR